jgi:TRAP-type C4-dicarboxylate transport system permease small subunit
MNVTADAIHRAVQAAGRAAVTCALLGIMALLTLGIVIRVFPVMSVAGYDEIIELLVAWMIFLGAALLWGEGALYRVDVLIARLPGRPAWALGVMVHLAMLLFAVVLTVEGWRVAVLSAETTPFLRFPKSLAYGSMPVAGVIMTGYSLAAICRALAGAPASR